jgi:hypothetical protein
MFMSTVYTSTSVSTLYQAGPSCGMDFRSSRPCLPKRGRPWSHGPSNWWHCWFALPPYQQVVEMNEWHSRMDKHSLSNGLSYIIQWILTFFNIPSQLSLFLNYYIYPATWMCNCLWVVNCYWTNNQSYGLDKTCYQANKRKLWSGLK